MAARAPSQRQSRRHVLRVVFVCAFTVAALVCVWAASVSHISADQVASEVSRVLSAIVSAPGAPEGGQPQTSDFTLVTQELFPASHPKGSGVFGGIVAGTGNTLYQYGGQRISYGASAASPGYYMSVTFEAKDFVTAPLFSDGCSEGPGRGYATGTYFLDNVYVIGGMNTQGGEDTTVNYVGGVFKFKNTECGGIGGGGTQFDRFGHATVVWNDRLVMMGGQDSSGELNDVWLTLDGSTWVQAPTQPASSIWDPRHFHAAAVLNNTIFVFGGMVGDMSVNGVGAVLNDLWKSDDAVTWTCLRENNAPTTDAPFFAGRYLHAATVWHGYIYVTGGCSVSSADAAADAASAATYSPSYTTYYDVWRTADGENWQQVTAYAAWAVTDALGKVHGRCAHNMAVAGDVLYLMAGTQLPELVNAPAYSATYPDAWSATPELDCLVNGQICDGVGVCGPPQYPAGTPPSDYAKYPRLCQCNGTYGGLFCAGCAEGHYGPTCGACDVVSTAGDGSITVCNGHGTCNGGGTRHGTGACECEYGWTLHDDCSACTAGFGPPGECTTCEAGYYGPNCAACDSCAGKVHAHCDGNGTHSGTGACVCDAGFTGDACDTCAEHFQAPSCSSCVTGWAPQGACDTCATGYYGPACTACPTCGAHSSCDGSGTTGGTGACVCDAGWAPPSCTQCAEGFTGASCNECEDGYYGPDCLPCPGLSSSGGATTVCSGHGTCDGSGTRAGTGVCSCTGVYKGTACDACPSGFWGPSCSTCPACVMGTCNGTGTTGGTGLCDCTSSKYTGTLCNKCNPPWTTGGYADDDSSIQCECSYPYSGTNCNKCVDDRYGPTCSTTCANCQHGGTFVGCEEQSPGGHCSCTAAYNGTTCTSCSAIAVHARSGTFESTCYPCPLSGDGVVCNGRGTCVAPSFSETAASCECLPQWSGSACTTYSNTTNVHDDDDIGTPVNNGMSPGEIIAIVAGVIATAFVGGLTVWCIKRNRDIAKQRPDKAEPLLSMSPTANARDTPPSRRAPPPPPPPSRPAANPYTTQGFNPYSGIATPTTTAYGNPPMSAQATLASQQAMWASVTAPVTVQMPQPPQFVGNPAVTTVPMAPHRPPPSAPSGMYGSAAPSAPSAPAPSAPDTTPLKPSVYGAGSEEDWRDVRGSNPGTIHTSNSNIGGGGGSGGGSGAGTGSGSGAGGAGAGGSTPKDTLPEVKWEELDGMTKLGQGSFGVVHKARWRGTLVAVKVPMSQGEDITEEAALLQRVANHPNVLSLIGLCHHPFQAIVLPFMEKGSLEDMVVLEGRQNVRGTLPWRTGVKMLLEAAAGVLHLHREGIIHRDLACRNLLVDAHNHVCVADFGMARAKEAARSEGFTRTLAGPIKWEAPECLARKPGEKPFNAKTDVFSFGVTMWEVMAGSAPWPGKDNRFAGRAVVNGLRQDVPQGDPVLASLVEDCWAQDPEARPQMAQVVRRLAAHIDKGQVPDGSFAQVFGK